ncbi:WecB/TagA/CpsF family glycosyltransferase [Shewanella frigidimarina]|uniref:WecB/TagA/CpsF family glycosyltransferase n=1 Tax=Shewanella frigidimarina TaxID=56812 RepID=UPI003F9F0C6E
MKNNMILNKIKILEESELNYFIRNLIEIAQPTTLGFINQHGYNLITESSDVYKFFMQLDFVLRDGVGIEIACKINGVSPGLNLNGTDFIPKLISYTLSNHTKVNFISYGTVEPWLKTGSNSLFKSFPFHSLDGFKADADYLQHLNKHVDPSSLNIIVLAMGMPKQERIAQLLKKSTNNRLLIICGGAILDFQAERYKRAPKFFRNNGIEWSYRLYKEPIRMFRRYVVGIPKFLFYIFKG